VLSLAARSYQLSKGQAHVFISPASRQHFEGIALASVWALHRTAGSCRAVLQPLVEARTVEHMLTCCDFDQISLREARWSLLTQANAALNCSVAKQIGLVALIG